MRVVVRPDAHAAPTVRFPLVQSPRLLVALLVLAASGLIVMSLWLMKGRASLSVEWVALASLCGVLMVVCVVRWHRAQPQGCLEWNGKEWALELLQREPCVFPPEAVTVMLDLQWMLVLSCKVAAGRTCLWLWLEKAQGPQHWLALRRALYFNAGSSSPFRPPADAPNR